jgi:hypothetical protein
MNSNFSSIVAEQMHRATGISREQIFGVAEPQSRPLNLQGDAALMFPGYVGEAYQPGGPVLVAINPGGGGDGYAERSSADEEFYPILEAFHRSTTDTLREHFRAMNDGWVRSMRTWNLRRIIDPVLGALDCEVEQVAFLNAVPYRTRENRAPSVFARRQAWMLVTRPLLDVLQPGVLVALGQKAGDVLLEHYRGAAPTFTVQRSNGDNYVTPKAHAALVEIRNQRLARSSLTRKEYGT